ncbi:hypothetical protein [Micromonospora sp. DT31]|uniref:hypothetical protein n=1 Tax=Micromonospora sp. DT31 TaxID=3393434 RepID=UPI003CEB5950
MSQDLPVPRQNERISTRDDRPDDTTVVQWGDAESARPGRVSRSLTALGRDRRLPAVLAGLGAVAAVASLIGEWVVITVPVPENPSDGDAPSRLTNGVSEIGGFGAAYLVGLLGLAAVLALALRGAPGVRRHARLAGLGLVVGLFGVLGATASALEQIARRILYFLADQPIEAEHGRGLVTGFLTVALLAAALHLAGRDAEPSDGRPTDGEPADDRPARRLRAADDDLPPAPADLTVQPTVPFAGPERTR